MGELYYYTRFLELGKSKKRRRGKRGSRAAATLETNSLHEIALRVHFYYIFFPMGYIIVMISFIPTL